MAFLPKLEEIPEEVCKKAKLLFLNYPNNPTGAVADDGFYEKAVAFAKKYDILLCHDAAYSEIAYEGYSRRVFSPLIRRRSILSSSILFQRHTA